MTIITRLSILAHVLCGPFYSLLLASTIILTTDEMFSMWSAPCPVLGKGGVNMHPKYVFYVVRVASI
jgi:hypothetical protein